MERALKKLEFKKDFSGIIKGCFIALSVSLFGILIFALVLRFVNLSDITIKIVNQVIKFLSVMFGVFVSLKSGRSKRLFKGACVGAIYTILSYLVFSILVSNFNFGLSTLFDILFASISGIICAVIFGVKK